MSTHETLLKYTYYYNLYYNFLERHKKIDLNVKPKHSLLYSESKEILHKKGGHW